jgi:hypothetical protein
MAVWEYKVISSGKGGFATPALLESFLNQLGTDEWEIVEFRGQPDNALAFSGLARRPTQRDWTLGDAAAAAAKVEADKLRIEFEAKFKSATSTAPAAEADAPEAPKGDARETDGLRRLRDTNSDGDPDAPEAPEDDWDKLGSEEELPTFFEAMRPHMRRNQRGPGFSVGVDFLAKKWQISEGEVLGALKECGLEIPDDEDAKVTYVDYDGDLFWVNVNRRGEIWVNTKEKTRPIFRTVQGTKIEGAEEPQKAPEGDQQQQAPQENRQENRHENRRENRHEERRQRRDQEPQGDPNAPAAPLPEGTALLDRIRPLMRKNRREPGGSGSTSFLSRALKCSEATLVEAFEKLGLSSQGAAGDPPVFAVIGDETWWLNKDNRGGIWINAREKRADGGPEQQAVETSESATPPAGNVFAAVRLLLKETKTGSVAAPIERLASEIGKSTDELLGALTSSGLRIPEKSREKPVFAEHAGEIFWLNLNGKGELWLNAKASKYSDGDEGKGRRPKKKKSSEDERQPSAEAPAEASPESPVS